MVLPLIIKEIVKVGVRYGSRYFAAENKAFKSLYRGTPRGVRTGVRHGLAVGSVAGSFINTGDDDIEDGTFQKQSPSNQLHKTRGRRSGRFSRRHASICRACRRARCICTGRRKRRSYRK